MSNEKKTMWVKCNDCGYEMSAELSDCRCEQCEAFDWSEPYPESGEDMV